MAKFVLKSLNFRVPNIAINDQPIVIGRSPLTTITDRRLSKKQLKITPYMKKKEVMIEVCGQNKSKLNECVLSQGQSKIAYPGDKIELLEDVHEYKLELEMTNHHTRHWSQGLYASMEDPDLLVFQDEVLCVIKDKYPKAEHHFLVLPKEKLTTLYDLHESHLEVIKQMVKIAEKKVLMKWENRDFKLGFHAVPSMAQVHMHVISQDFNSDCLKTKKHWNSFNTAYFVPAQKVIEILEQKGRIQPEDLVDGTDMKSLLKTDLQCNQCDFKPKNMPQLKEHLKSAPKLCLKSHTK